MKMPLKTEIFLGRGNMCRKFEVRLKCPNPLFEKWLEEWRLEAAAKDLDIQHTFRKALVSLRKFPITLKNGRQCWILEDFSPKLCQKLDNKLLRYRLQFPNGEFTKCAKSPEIIIDSREKCSETEKMDVSNNSVTDVCNVEVGVLQSGSAEDTEKIVVDDSIHSVENLESKYRQTQIPKPLELNEISDNQSAISWFEDVWKKNNDLQPNKSDEIVSNDNNHDILRPPIKVKICFDKNKSPAFSCSKNKKLTKRKKEYVPIKWSGAHALLVTLHDYSCRFGYGVGMPKSELKKEAQSLCDVPFDQRYHGSYYTAWSAMGQLCKKHLVIKIGHPARYSLTDAGIKLAEKLKYATAESNSINDRLNLTSLDNSVNSNTDFGPNKKASPPNTSINNGLFLDINKPSTSRSVELHENRPFDINRSSKNKRKRGSLLRSLYSSKVHTFSSSESADEGEGINGELITKTTADTFIDRAASTPGVSNFKKSVKEIIKDLNSNPKPISDWIKLKREPSCTIVRPPEEINEKVCERDVDLNEGLLSYLNIKNKNMDNSASKILIEGSSSTSSKSNIQKNIGTNEIKYFARYCKGILPGTSSGDNNHEEDTFEALSQKSMLVKPCPVKSHNSMKISQSALTSLQENIVMYPMMYEVILLVDTAEKGMLRSDAMQNHFTKEKIGCEIRHLNVGDYTWICRDQAGHELILPYIVERKRLDDFSKSIKDGRFHEQKFRLKSACVKQRIYIVESYGNGHAGGLPLSTLMQAATNTQIIDGFMVKFTKDYQHTVKYLATISRKFISLLNNKTLKTCFGDELPPFSWNNYALYLMTFDDFMKNANKKRKFNVREMFIRHLMLLHGVSVEKARTIVDKYPCPRVLIEAYQNGTGDKDLLSKIKENQLARCLGPVISNNIYKLYSNQKFR